ncbi:MAG TPA: DUF6538 domain-containing protein [Steroidobacteraceae bacterium]|jgi:integrase
MNTEHLRKRNNVWFVRVVIPPHLRQHMGKRELIRTTKTHDLAVANRRKHQMLADIQAMIAQADMARTMPKESSEYVLAAAREARASVLAGTAMADAELGLDATIENHLELLRKQNGEDDEGNPKIGAAHENVIRLAHKELAGQTLGLLSVQVKAYLNELRHAERPLRNQTIREKERAFSEFQAWLVHDVEVDTITRAMAGQYRTEKLVTKQVSAQTTKGTLSHFSALWTWLMDERGLVESNPWARMGGKKESKRGKEKSRRPWTDAELLALMKVIPKDDALFPLAAIAAYTGARREEICLLRKADVDGNVFKIREGKSHAAVREVPIHSAIRPIVARLVKTSTDDYLIPGLLTGGMDEKRGHLLGKRFGYFIRHNGFPDTKLKFHTFRNTVSQRFEAAGVPLPVAKQIIGHERDDLTYGTYSDGIGTKELTKTMAKLTYGALDEYMQGAAGKVKVETRSHRRPTRRKVVA